MEEIHFRILFNGYFKDLINFYKFFENQCEVSNTGVLTFNKLKIIYSNKITNNKSSIDIKDCQLNLTITKKLTQLKKELSKNNININNENENSFKIIDPSGLVVNILYSNTFKIPTFEIPFNENIQIIDDFYTTLGIESKNGVLNLKNIVFYFFSENENIPIMSNMFEFSFFTEDTLSNIEQIVRNKGGNIVEYIDNFLGKKLIIQDPAKLTLIIEF